MRVLSMRCLGLMALLVSPAVAQDRPSAAVSDAAPAAERTDAEWSALASGLEQRVARLLPCDARVRSAIEEVSRASDARFAALSASWQDAAKRSSEQTELANKLVADLNARLAAWKTGRADSEQEWTRLTSQVSVLRDSAGRRPALASALSALDAISRNSQTVADQAVDRETMGAQWNARLNDFIEASQARQSAIENELKALAAEASRWSAFYAARLARAQVECSLTESPAASDDRPARTTGKKGK